MNEPDPPIDAEFEAVSPEQSRLGLPFRAVWLVFAIISMAALGLLATAVFGLKGLDTGAALSPDSPTPQAPEVQAPLSTDHDEPAPELVRLNQQVESMAIELDNMARLIETQSETINSLLGQSQRLEALSANQDVLVAAINQLQQPSDPAPDASALSAQSGDDHHSGTAGDGIAALPAQAAAGGPGESTSPAGATMPDTLLNAPAQTDIGIDALRGDLADIRTQLAALSAQPAPSQLDQAALALMMIDGASARGAAFTLGFQQLSMALPDDPGVAALADVSNTGVSTMDMLAEEFGILKARILDYETRNTRHEPGWMTTLFGDSIRIRQTAPTTLGTRLDSVATALAADDLGLAIANLETLDPELRRPFEAWLEQARNRQKLDQILHQLRLTLISKGQP